MTKAGISYNHRMVWVGGGLKGHPFPTACHEQGHFPLHEDAQSPNPPGLEHLQKRTSTTSLGNIDLTQTVGEQKIFCLLSVLVWGGFSSPRDKLSGTWTHSIL